MYVWFQNWASRQITEYTFCPQLFYIKLDSKKNTKIVFLDVVIKLNSLSQHITVLRYAVPKFDRTQIFACGVRHHAVNTTSHPQFLLVAQVLEFCSW